MEWGREGGGSFSTNKHETIMKHGVNNLGTGILLRGLWGYKTVGGSKLSVTLTKMGGGGRF